MTEAEGLMIQRLRELAAIDTWDTSPNPFLNEVANAIHERVRRWRAFCIILDQPVGDDLETVATHLIAQREAASEELQRLTASLEDEREACARLLELPMGEILLHMGELTAQEKRSLKAFIIWRAAAIRSRKEKA